SAFFRSASTPTARARERTAVSAAGARIAAANSGSATATTAAPRRAPSRASSPPSESDFDKDVADAAKFHKDEIMNRLSGLALIAFIVFANGCTASAPRTDIAEGTLDRPAARTGRPGPSLSTSGSDTCLVTFDGVACWGDNTYGQTTVPALNNPKQVSSYAFS